MGDARLIAHPGSKIANHQTYRQHHGKGQQAARPKRRAYRGAIKEIETATLITVATTDGQRP